MVEVYMKDGAKLKACILNLKACLEIATKALQVLDRNGISDSIAKEALERIDQTIDRGMLENATANGNKPQ
jgi:hypothetical protein